MNEALTRLVDDRVRGGTPVCLYWYDLNQVTEHVRRVVTTLPEPCRMYYAMKANSAAPLLRTLAPLVAGFEVASGGELATVRAVDQHAAVLLGGPAKTEDALVQALRQRVLRFHVESVLELHRISAVAGRIGRTADILLRVNLAGSFPAATLAMAGRPTQFGLDETLLAEAVETARALPRLRLVGFHLHSLSNNLSAAAHLDLIEMYCHTVLGWERDFSFRSEVVNFGGGIGVNYADVDAQFDWGRFTRGLGRLVRESFPPHWREVDFECGRYLVARCGRYVAEVLDVRRNHGRNYVVIRGGTHHFRLPSSWQHSHPFSVVAVDRWSLPCPRPEVRDEPVTVVGELCTPKDVLARDVPISRVRAGDVLVFTYAGAYGWDISHHDFLSHPHPERLFHPSTPPPRAAR